MCSVLLPSCGSPGLNSVVTFDHRYFYPLSPLISAHGLFNYAPNYYSHFTDRYAHTGKHRWKWRIEKKNHEWWQWLSIWNPQGLRRGVWDFGFPVWETCIDRDPWEMGLKSKHEIHFCFISTLGTYPEGNFVWYFQWACVLTVSHWTRSGMEFSIRGIRLLR